MWTFFGLLFLAWISPGIYKLMKHIKRKEFERTSREAAATKALEEQQRKAQQEYNELKALTRQAQKINLSPKDFLVKFTRAFFASVKESGRETPSPFLTKMMLDAVYAVYQHSLPPTLPPPTNKQELERDAHRMAVFDEAVIAGAFAQAYKAFLDLLPNYPTPQFTLPIAEVIDLPSTTWGMFSPFRQLQIPGCYGLWAQFQNNCVKAGGGEAPVFPQDFKSDWPRNKVAHLYFQQTPFDQLLQTQIPFGFDDETRCTHHWCLGHNGTGKTTYLRHFIKADLERVVKGECSLVVIDSKKLIREMRTLKVLHEMKDRVLIVDPEHPIALNPFYLPRKQAKDVMRYMLASISEASDLQTGALTFLIDAAAAYPSPTLRTIRDFFNLKKDELPDRFFKFDPDTQDYFRNAFQRIPPLTRSGLHTRITNFIKENETLCTMLNADRCVLDLFDFLHQGGNVLLVDTDRGNDSPEATNVLGRLFIALLDQLSSRRTRLDEKTLKPIFVVLDEAHDYIKDDMRFADILEKARAQKISMTVAHHHEEQIDPRIQASLRQAGIKSYCPDIKRVEVKTRRRDFTIPVEPYSFEKDELHMTRPEYAALRKRMNEKYGLRPVTQPSPSEPISQSFDEP